MTITNKYNKLLEKNKKELCHLYDIIYQDIVSIKSINNKSEKQKKYNDIFNNIIIKKNIANSSFDSKLKIEQCKNFLLLGDTQEIKASNIFYIIHYIRLNNKNKKIFLYKNIFDYQMSIKKKEKDELKILLFCNIIKF